MNSTTRVNPEAEHGGRLGAIVRDIAALRQDFADLMSQMKSGALKGANGAAEDALGELSDKAKHLYDRVTAQGERTVKAVGQSGRGATRHEPSDRLRRGLHRQPAAQPLSAVIAMGSLIELGDVGLDRIREGRRRPCRDHPDDRGCLLRRVLPPCWRWPRSAVRPRPSGSLRCPHSVPSAPPLL